MTIARKNIRLFEGIQATCSKSEGKYHTVIGLFFAVLSLPLRKPCPVLSVPGRERHKPLVLDRSACVTFANRLLTTFVRDFLNNLVRVSKKVEELHFFLASFPVMK